MPEHRIPPPSASLLARFRSHKKRLPLHPLERAVLTVVALHLCFLPWALGTMHPWSQITSLVISVLGFGLAMIPRHYTADQTGGPSFRLNPWPRLLKFPIFWIGLALLAYITIQGFNPSWVWERNATHWWLRRVNDIPWLPTSVDTPFERFNLWRQFIIYASAWLTVCTVWVGFTRRRSLEFLLWIMALNGVVLVITGLALRMFRPSEFVLWFEQPRVGVITFASFIYKNHAGAWLALGAAVLVFLAAVHHQRSMQKMERSSPAMLFVLGALLIFFAEIFTYSRGGTLILAAFLALSVGLYLRHRFTSQKGHTPASVPISAMLIGALVVGYGASQLDFSDAEQRFSLLFGEKSRNESLVFRESAHHASIAMLADHWDRGVGAGGFRYRYTEYIKQHPEAYKGGRLFWEHAHNDWLQIPIELGAAGCSLLLLGVSWWLWGVVRCRVWRDLPALLLAFGLCQTLLHATFDFPFQNPAVLNTWCVLAVLTIRRLELERA